MRYLKRIQGGVLIFLASTTFAIAQDNDGCAQVLQFSARDYTEERSDIGIAVKIYGEHCENGSVKNGKNLTIGAEAVINAIPAKFSLGKGSTSERIQYFCKTFESDFKRNEQVYRSASLVVDKTTNAWLECKNLAARGLVFRPQISKTQVLIDIVRKGAEPISVQSVEYDAGLAKCTVPNTNASKTTVTADNKTVKSLDSGSWTISCTRTPEVKKKETIYPAMDISVRTTKGPFLLPVMADAKYPYEWASEYQNRLDAIEQNVSRIGVRHGTIAIEDKDTKSLTADIAECLDNPENLRGTINGRITFDPPFETAPEVSAGLTRIDLSGDTNRIDFVVKEVDKIGFNYQFFTWCKTKVYSARASWIAVAK